MVRKTSAGLPLTSHDISSRQFRETTFTLYKSALTLNPISPPSFFYVFVNFFIQIVLFYTLSLLISLLEGALIILPISFALYFLIIYGVYIFASAAIFRSYRGLDDSLLKLTSLMSFTILYLPPGLFIARLLGPLSFIFVFASALITNYYMTVLLDRLNPVSDSRTYFITGLLTIILAFMVSYGTDMAYSSAVAKAISKLQ